MAHWEVCIDTFNTFLTEEMIFARKIKETLVTVICLVAVGMSTATAATVNLALPLNQDVVWGSDVSGSFDGAGGSALMSSSISLLKGQSSINGLPDNGSFAAVNLKHPAVTLSAFNNNGNNVYQPLPAALPTVNALVAHGQYKEVHVYASASLFGGGVAQFKIVSRYTDFTTATSAIFTVPDWIGTTGGNDYILIDGLGRVNVIGSYDSSNGNVFAVFGFRTSINSAKTLASVDIAVTTNTATSINFFGGIATTTNTLTNAAPTAASVMITDNNAGSVVVGDNLTGSYIYGDVDGDVEGTSTFRWLRNGTVIPGAAAPAYTLVAADIGQSITFEITPIAMTGIIQGLAVGTSIINSAPTAVGVTITGTARVGNILTGSYTYGDVDGDAEGTSTFRWLRGGTVISGAAGITYVPVAADSGQTIKFEVTPIAAAGTTPGTAAASVGTLITNTAPVLGGIFTTAGAVNDNASINPFSAVSVSDVDNDSVSVHITFTAANGILAGTGVTGSNGSYTIISAAAATAQTNLQGLTFTPTANQVAPGITVVTTFTLTPNDGTANGTVDATTRVTATSINNVPVNTSVPVLSGTAKVGNVSSSSTGVWIDVDFGTVLTYIYQWYRADNNAGLNESLIPAATASSYTLALADANKFLRVIVTANDGSGSSNQAATSTRMQVINSAPTASNVTVSGTATVGNILTGSYTYADVDADLEGTSTFRWLRGVAAITGATASTYTLVAADSGQAIKFEVTPVAAAGATPGTAVASVGTTILNSAPMASSVTVIGTAIVGNNLTGIYTYGDMDGDVEGISTFRWLRGSAVITAATGITYALVAADGGQTIKFEVTPVAATGMTPGVAVASAGTPVAAAPPPPQSAPPPAPAPGADLAIYNFTAVNPVAGGSLQIYTLTITNQGPLGASAVVVNNNLPAGLNLILAIPDQGTCTGTVNISCTLGTLASGASTSVRLAVVPQAAAGMLVNFASVSSATSDPNSSNNQSGMVINVVAGAPDVASLALNISTFNAGSGLTLFATVTPGTAAVEADIYLAIQFPDGRLFFRQPDGSFARVIAPALVNTMLAPFSGPVFSYIFNGLEPTGQYEWFLILTRPGTAGIIGQISSASFTFTP